MTDQTELMPRLIRVFSEHTATLLVFSHRGSIMVLEPKKLIHVHVVYKHDIFQAVQTGTVVFIKELKSRNFPL